MEGRVAPCRPLGASSSHQPPAALDSCAPVVPMRRWYRRWYRPGPRTTAAASPAPPASDGCVVSLARRALPCESRGTCFVTRRVCVCGVAFSRSHQQRENQPLLGDGSAAVSPPAPCTRLARRLARRRAAQRPLFRAARLLRPLMVALGARPAHVAPYRRRLRSWRLAGRSGGMAAIPVYSTPATPLTALVVMCGRADR